MFTSKKELNTHIKWAEYELKDLREMYWSLWRKHELLLKHFGLEEREIPSRKELRTKGGPEQGE